jgi:flagellar basal-body rod protein FlgB
VLNPVYIFSLAGQHAQWATVRQAAIAGNIANANTSGYTTVDVEPFAKILDEAGVTMARTSAGHIGASGRGADEASSGPWEIERSTEPVALDTELMKADTTNRAFALDTAIVSAFHRMLMTSVRSAL